MTGRLILLAALVAVLAIALRWRTLVGEAPPPAPEAGRPGYYLTGVDLEEYGEDGELIIGLRSVSAQEDPASGVVTLAEVAVDYHADDGQPWQLTAAQARVPQGSSEVEFEGNVKLAGMPAGRSDTTELRTDRMTLDTETERARTDSAVELVFGRHLMHAKGMKADLKGGHLELEADVNGTFTP